MRSGPIDPKRRCDFLDRGRSRPYTITLVGTHEERLLRFNYEQRFRAIRRIELRAARMVQVSSVYMK